MRNYTKLATITLLSLVTFSNAFSLENSPSEATPKPHTLIQSILLAISLNPKTKSKDVQIEAMHEQTLAAKANQYPSGSVNCSYGYTQGKVAGVPEKGTYADCSLSASATLYDGDSAKFAYLASKEQEDAARQRFNSTNKFIQNTKGQLAGDTVRTFIEISASKQSVIAKTKNLDILNNLYALTNDSNTKGLIKAQVTQAQISLAQAKSNYSQALSEFKYVVTILPADNLENLEQSIASLKIPGSVEEAVKISLERNPDVQATNASLRAADYTYKSVRASMGPKVSVVATIDTNLNHDSINSVNNYSGHSNYIGVQLSLPLSLSLSHYTKSQALSKKYAQLDSEAALDDARHGLESTYDELAAQLIQHDLLVTAYNEALETVEETQRQIANNEDHLPSVQTALDQYFNMNNQLSSLLNSQMAILSIKFSIQQLAGTVFDQPLALK